MPTSKKDRKLKKRNGGMLPPLDLKDPGTPSVQRTCVRSPEEKTGSPSAFEQMVYPQGVQKGDQPGDQKEDQPGDQKDNQVTLPSDVIGNILSFSVPDAMVLELQGTNITVRELHRDLQGVNYTIYVGNSGKITIHIGNSGVINVSHLLKGNIVNLTKVHSVGNCRLAQDSFRGAISLTHIPADVQTWQFPTEIKDLFKDSPSFNAQQQVRNLPGTVLPRSTFGMNNKNTLCNVDTEYGVTHRDLVYGNTNLNSDVFGIIQDYLQSRQVVIELKITAPVYELISQINSKTSELSVVFRRIGDTIVLKMTGIKLLDLNKMLGPFISTLIRVEDFGQSRIVPGCFYGASSLVSIPDFHPGQLPSNCAHLFFGCKKMQFRNIPFKTGHVTNMSFMFAHCDSFNPVEIAMETKNVTDMSGMFRGCKLLNVEIPFDTTNVMFMSNMFNGCISFRYPVNFDTSSVISMKDIFIGSCSYFFDLDAEEYYEDPNPPDEAKYDAEFGPRYGPAILDHNLESDFDENQYEYAQDLMNNRLDDRSDSEWD